MHNTIIRGLIYLLPLLAGPQAQAGEADVVDVKAGCEASCTFYVTVRHADEGWDHYADRWEILTTDGKLIATRVLAHPHEEEQPFTRSLNRVDIPAGVSQVIVRAHDSIHGFGGKQVTVKIDGQD
jgi:hypothetical protein